MVKGIRFKEYQNSELNNGLSGELIRLFLSASSFRITSGANLCLQKAVLCAKDCDEENIQCDHDHPESDDNDEYAEDVYTTEEVLEREEEINPFEKLAKLLCNLKAYDYISIVKNAYSTTGNKLFKLKSNKDIELTDDELNKISADFREAVNAYINANAVKVDEIPMAFNFDTMAQMLSSVKQSLIDEKKRINDTNLQMYHDKILRSFNNTDFVNQYIKAIEDTTIFPIGVLWLDDKSLSSKPTVKDGKFTINRSIQFKAERVYPTKVWFTPDYTYSEVGRAVFRLKRFTKGDITAWANPSVCGSEKIVKSIKEFLEQYTEGEYISSALLFRNYYPGVSYDYDVLIARGKFTREYIEDMGIHIPKYYNGECYIPCEAYFVGKYILRLRVLDAYDEHLGVYTTVFRQNADSLYGISVYEHCMPYALMYQKANEAINEDVGKIRGMILQLDESMIDNPEKYFKRDANGNIVVDISQGMLLEFDGATQYSPNSKGVPLTIETIPTNINTFVSVVEYCLRELDRITNIPAILTESNDISSALRTTSNMNMAYNASAKVIKALLREAENRMLKPAIRYAFDCISASGEIPKSMIETEPEILMSDEMIRSYNDDIELIRYLQMLAQYRGIIPDENIAKLINRIGRTAGLQEDLIPGIDSIKVSAPDREVQEQQI